MELPTVLIVLSILGISFLLVYLLLSFLLRVMIFPGSFSLWRHWWQFNLENELGNNFIDHLHEIRYVIDLLEKSSNLLHIKKNHKQLQESLDIFKVLLNSYTQLEDKDMNTVQKAFKSKLASVVQRLSETTLIFPDKSEDLFSAMYHSNDFDWNHATFEDFPDNLSLKQSGKELDDLENFVASLIDLKCFRKISKEGVFTNLNILRLILQSSIKCEQFWVRSENVEIDCVLVKNTEKNEGQGVIIYCNPNGGLYEYACYQNTWLEFYVSQGVDFCMYNYRGYGRSGGKPSSSSMVKDIKKVFDFLHGTKGYQKIGVHGESIGAVPACFLSKSCEISFLFADRSFSSLSVLFQAYLAFPNKVFKCVSGWSDETLNNYLSTTCYKVFSCDINDGKILEKSSLKAGISLKQDCFLLEKATLAEMLKSLEKLSNFLKAFKVSEKLNFGLSDDAGQAKDLDSVDEMRLKEICLKIFSCVSIDAGGVLLTDVKDLAGLELWVKVLQIWGSFLPIGSCLAGRDKAMTKVKTAVAVLNEIFRENEFIVNSNVIALCQETRLLKKGMLMILKSLENFYRTDTEELSLREDEEIGCKMTGFLLPVGCGHDGRYSDEERGMLLEHLKLAKFLS